MRFRVNSSKVWVMVPAVCRSNRLSIKKASCVCSTGHSESVPFQFKLMSKLLFSFFVFCFLLKLSLSAQYLPDYNVTGAVLSDNNCTQVTDSS